jgi:hypothetical protein
MLELISKNENECHKWVLKHFNLFLKNNLQILDGSKKFTILLNLRPRISTSEF